MALNAQEIINYIADSPKKTPVKIYVNLSAPVDFGSAEVFGEGKSRIVFGDWAELAPILEDNREKITDCVVENDRRNSGVPLLDLKDLKARIEPGAIIREKVEIGEGAVIMMGAILNIGAVVGKRTMIDMGAACAPAGTDARSEGAPGGKPAPPGSLRRWRTCRRRSPRWAQRSARWSHRRPASPQCPPPLPRRRRCAPAERQGRW